MITKEIKTPLFLGLASYCVSILISIFCTLIQDTAIAVVVPLSTNPNRDKVFPIVFFSEVIFLAVYLICLLMMFTYEGSSRRGVGIAMIVMIALGNMASPFISLIGNVFMAAKDADSVMAHAALNSVISTLTVPFSVLASILLAVAVGRYGISRIPTDPA